MVVYSMAFEVAHVPLNLLDTYYPVVAEGLRHMTERDDKTGWNEWSVYHDIVSGAADLYICGSLPDTYYGFFILSVESDGTSRDLHVWIFYSEGESDVLENGLDAIRDLATEAKCDNITFSTRRRGWEKVGRRLGFELDEVRYRMKV
jgi:hypothetical protein